MSKIKEIFTIKELENISGISAHSIRIWERRFGLFQPKRKTNNVRRYGLSSLKELLNIALLKKKGYKISEIAQLSNEEVVQILQETMQGALKKEKILAQIKIAMYQFDANLFEEVYQEASAKYSFKIIFREVFFPFLHFLGLYWQTKTISIAHEHFISNLIYQKLQLNIANINAKQPYISDKTYILYLPEEEMHEISLLYLNYELKLKGYRTVYLGRCVPVNDLKYLKKIFPKITWVASFSLSISSEKFQNYLEQIQNLIEDSPHHFVGVGANIIDTYLEKPFKNIRFYASMRQVLEILSK